MVMIKGEVMRIGGKNIEREDYDIIGIMKGYEGMIGVVKEIKVRIMKKNEKEREIMVGFK